MDLFFEWHVKKAELNFHKHGVSFEEARTVFYNPLAKIFDDVDHSTREKREILIGHSNKGRFVIVVFVEKKENVIRLISARSATKKEKRDYEEKFR